MTELASFSVKKYHSENQNHWDNFVRNSKNGTFLHLRGFMDYHSDRFEDYSLMVYEKNKLIAVLPANRVGDKLFSHQGLTYGDLILSKKIKFYKVLEAFKSILSHLEENGFQQLEIKRIPQIYEQYPAEELDYLLFIVKAENTRTDLSATIFQKKALKIQSNRLEGVKKAQKNGLEIKKTTEFERFWNKILIPNLEKKYKSKPVHSLKEIELLARKFPKNIHQFNVCLKDKIVGGCTVFETKTTAHIQYISSDSDRQQLGTLDFLFEHLIWKEFADKTYFDFGTSNENQGKNLNRGLLYWKECFGARAIAYSTYQIKVKNHHLLNSVFI